MKDYLERAKKMYSNCGEEIQSALRDIFGKAILPIEDRIKTLDDAIEFLGKEHPLVQARDILLSYETEVLNKVIIGLELKIICTALNSEDLVSFSETGWVPTFKFVTTMDSTGSLVCTGSVLQSHSLFDVVFKSQELAAYAGKQFIGYWKEYLLR